MSTEIDLQFPYNTIWRKGYLNINSEGRKTITLFNSSSDRSSVQYARYLLAVNLGRFLTDNEEADHIDEDKTNDDISNLQVLSCIEHRQKNVVKLQGTCYICGCLFERTKTQLRPRIKQEYLIKGLLTCSRACGYKKTSETLKKHRLVTGSKPVRATI